MELSFRETFAKMTWDFRSRRRLNPITLRVSRAAKMLFNKCLINTIRTQFTYQSIMENFVEGLLRVCINQ